MVGHAACTARHPTLRQAPRLFGERGIHQAHVLGQYPTMEKWQGAEGLALGGGGDVLRHGQVGGQSIDFG